MALRTRTVGQGLGIRPVNLSSPYLPDSDFDSTVRIPVRNTSYVRPPAPITAAPQAPALTAAAAPAPQGLGAGQANYPSVIKNPPPTPTEPPPTPPPPADSTPPQQPPPGYDPNQLNQEGYTFKPGVEPYTSSVTVNQQAVSNLLTELEGFSGVKIDPAWRSMSGADLVAYVDKAIAYVKEKGTLGNRPDTSFRNRLDDWLRRFHEAASTTQSPNPEYQQQYLGQQIFNNAVQRLKMQGAADSREQDEALLSMLASRGLLHSGVAAKELSALRQARQKNFIDAASRLNELLLSNELGRLTQRDLLTLQADLQRRNQEAYLRLQQRLADANKPNEWLQAGATVVGTALPFLLSRSAPGREGSGEIITDDRKVGYRNA